MNQRSAFATVAFVTSATLSVDTWAGKRRYAVELVELSAARAAVVALEQFLVGTEVQLQCSVPVWSRRFDLDVAAVVRWRTEMRARDMILGRDCTVYGLELRPTPRQEHQLFQSVFCIEQMQRATTASNAGERAEAVEGDARAVEQLAGTPLSRAGLPSEMRSSCSSC